jgi:hypothetical protein
MNSTIDSSVPSQRSQLVRFVFFRLVSSIVASGDPASGIGGFSLR